jgi:hypothetical protein
VLWFWINGNISKQGITNDLEAYKEAGVGGVLWMEVSGPQWPPMGQVKAYTPEWMEHFQWAISECARLGLEFGMTQDYGYSSGGPHITPENSMQKLYWSETEVAGGQTVEMQVPKPEISKELVHFWLDPDETLNPKVQHMIDHVDAYRDVAVLAYPRPATEQARQFRIPGLKMKSGLESQVRPRDEPANPVPFSPEAVIDPDSIIDLTALLQPDGSIRWDAPAGDWLILRIGHSSNYHMTRPSPASAVGFEADRLSASGIEAHFDAFIRPILEAAGEHVGTTLTTIHHDSWEAGYQNWTAAMPEKFAARRGYDLRTWLPVLTGRVVGDMDASHRFLDDLSRTASDLIIENFTGRLRELARPYGLQFSHESYGHLSIDFAQFAGVADIPMSEFWARGTTLYPNLTGYSAHRKMATSVANTYGRKIHASEAFTADRGWRDHPYLLKALGDKSFAEGINRIVLHCAVHQPYENAIPGLSHRKWGDHFTRFNTWWFYSQPWMEYMTRAQYLLQQGPSVSDLLYWTGEQIPRLPEDFRNPYLRLPHGYDYDVANNEIFHQLTVENGRIVAPSGTSYAYLAMPGVRYFSPEALRKLEELADAGGQIIVGEAPKGAFGLRDGADAEAIRLGEQLWNSGKLITGRPLREVLTENVAPDFIGNDIGYLHRQVGATDLYFVANYANEPVERVCGFRITDRAPELWNPKTGEIRALPNYTVKGEHTLIPMEFGPAQSWFVVFRENTQPASSEDNFPEIEPLRELAGPWQVQFDPKWGGTEAPLVFDKLIDWTDHALHDIRYYSGTATYRQTLNVSREELADPEARILLNLGQVEVMARVWINGKECGVAWMPPYRVDITDALQPGANELRIDVVNLWINRMIGDEFLPEDVKWRNPETVEEWPEWMLNDEPRPSGRYTFATIKHYDAAPLIYQMPHFITKDSEPFPSGLLGPVTLERITHP